MTLSDETLVVGGVGYNSGAGVAYVFTVSGAGAYQADQRIEHPDEVRAAAGESYRKYCYALCEPRTLRVHVASCIGFLSTRFKLWLEPPTMHSYKARQ